VSPADPGPPGPAGPSGPAKPPRPPRPAEPPRPSGPPRLAEALLGLVLPPGVVGDSILGDAREEHAEHVRRGGFAPALWYWIHAARLAGGYLVTRGREAEMDTVLKDLRFGARSLMRMPGSAAVAVVVLAIGIGLCSFMFSIIYGLYFRGMDIPEAHRVFVLNETNVELGQTQRAAPIQNFMDWRERQTSFEGLLGSSSGTVNLAGGADEPVRFSGAFVTANSFSLLHVEPIIGRGFVEGDDRPGAAPNIVLGYEAWRDAFGSDRSVIGRDVRVNGEPATVLGVMPEGFQFPNNTEVWVPLRDDALATARGEGRRLSVWGRLRDGVTEEQAALEMAGIARQLEQEYPEVNEGIGIALYTPVEANMDDTLTLVFGSMMFAVICVLLVACANVASLLLARAATRTKEAGVRVAMGGSRLRVMLPFLSEALVLAGVGALLGIGITYFGVGWFDEMTSPSRTGRPWFMQFEVDLPILGFVIALAGFTALLAGIAPAFQMSRTDVSTVLKDEARGSSGLHAGRMTRVLVTAEVALSCALLVGAGLMTKSIVKLGQTEYPFETERVFTARVGLFEADYPDQSARQRFWTDLTREVRAIPQVSAAALVDQLPYGGRNTFAVSIDGVDYGDSEDRPQINRVVTTPGYFETLVTELVSGRDFTEADDMDSELVAIVNQPMVERYFDGQNPIGRRFREGISDTLPLMTVVGVAPDLRMMGGQPEGLSDYEPAGYYVPLAQRDLSFISIAALARGDQPMGLTGDVRTAVRRVDPDLPIYNVFSEAEVVDRAVWFYRVFGTVFITFGLAALFMASVGLYGVLSFAVSRRTQEMGIRMALGAASGDVVRLVARQGAGQLGIGLLIGLGLAFGVTRAVSILMYQVDPQDPVVFGGVFALIVLVGVAAAVFPARRATSVDPVQALRAE
jgi:putative ABC transport system permease protein